MKSTNAAGGRRYPLAGHGDTVPPAPPWFDRALALAPERSVFTVDGAPIELLTWGERGNAGLLFLHGDAAHADWWSFIAPFFAGDFRCAAISWSGMGKSGWRDSYSMKQFAQEAISGMSEAGLCEGPHRPIAVAHSMGGYPALTAAHGATPFGGIVLIDTPIVAVPNVAALDPPGLRPHPSFGSLAEALDRFRFVPPHCGDDTTYAIRFVAERSLRHEGDGWTWCFDPLRWAKTTAYSDHGKINGLGCPVAYIRGEESVLVTPAEAMALRRLLGHAAPIVSIPAAGHHVMIDQPLALVAALRGLFARWPGSDR